MLEDHADALAQAAQSAGVEGGAVLAVDQDASAGGLLEAIDQAQQGALAGAGVADQTEDLTGADLQGGGLQGGDIAAIDPVRLVDVVELDHGKTLWVGERAVPRVLSLAARL
ncbi:hypothetical protein D3C75_1100280 [compost metagenome]